MNYKALTVAALALSFVRAPQEQHINVYTTGWQRGEPPIGRPIIGFWLDNGSPDAPLVIHYGDQYFEYAPHLKKQVGGLLYGVRPLWWQDLPGGAE